MKNAGKLYDTLWKEMQKAAKNALAGKGVAAVTTGGQLEAAIVAALTADASGKIAKGSLKLSGAIARPAARRRSR